MTNTYEITEFQKRVAGKREFITKFGGQPDWIRKADWPLSAPAFFTRDECPEGDWKLLLQLHCNFQPFVIRAGAMPTMFVFISGDFQKGGLLIQDA